MITLKTDIKEFTNIVHIADIQIRLTKRHDEYREVFSRLFESVKNTPTTTVVCVVGDIVHSKLDLSPECVQLTKEFLVGLANLRPMILVAGNHDTNLTNRHRLDSLSPIVEAINHPNLFYLRETGLYALGDICFNNYGIFDDISTYIKGEDIPKIHRNEYRHFVCLFHGTVDGAESELGFKLVNKSISVGNFDHHDIVLLGDIHKAQDMQSYSFDFDKPAIRYCGSLIQQNHGEDLDGHGYSYWDLKTKSYVQVPISNDYGYFTVLLDKGEITADLTRLPKKTKLRFQCFETVPTEVKAALSKIRKMTEVVEDSYVRVASADDDVKKNVVGNVKIGDLTNNDYQVKLITDYLKNTLKVTDQIIIDTVINIHNSANSSISKKDSAHNIRWKPIKFEWENLFSYGEGNCIDFTKAKNVIGIFAANASGKSAIFSSLSFCIFDKCDREFKASNILNDQKMGFKTKFEFEIDGIHYFIERNGNADKKGAVKVNVRFWKNENGKDVDLHGTERSDTNDIIRGYLGTYEDFVLTGLSVQSGKNISSFIDMGHTERKDLLSQFLGLSIFDTLHEVANKRLNELTGVLKKYKGEDYNQLLLEYGNMFAQAESTYNTEAADVVTLTEKRDLANQKIMEETQKLIKLEENIPPLSHSLSKKSEIEKKIPLIQNEMKVDTNLIADLSQQLTDVEKVIKELETKDVVNVQKIYQNHLAEKGKIQSDWDKAKAIIEHTNHRIKQSQEHQYDSNCKFCVANNSTLVKSAADAKKEMEEHKSQIERLTKQLINVEFLIASNRWVVEGFVTYTTSISKRSSIQSLQLKVTDRIIVARDLLAKLEDELDSYNERIELYNKNKESFESNEKVNARILEMKKFLTNIETMLKGKNKSVLDLNGKMTVWKTQIENINKKIDEVKKTEIEYKSQEIYVKAVCRDGIPYEVISSAVPQIESEVNNILTQIVDFQAKFEVDGKNVIPYIVYDNRKWLMNLTSGFEKFVMSLAIRVALSDISNLPRSSFLVVDEGFGVLDAEHLSSMYILFGYLKTQFDFVMVISHLDSMRDMVDSQIEIYKDKGFSKVNFV